MTNIRRRDKWNLKKEGQEEEQKETNYWVYTGFGRATSQLVPNQPPHYSRHDTRVQPLQCASSCMLALPLANFSPAAQPTSQRVSSRPAVLIRREEPPHRGCR